MYVKMCSDMGVDAWFETEWNNNIYKLATMSYKYYNEMKES